MSREWDVSWLAQAINREGQSENGYLLYVCQEREAYALLAASTVQADVSVRVTQWLDEDSYLLARCPAPPAYQF